jgi:hypothetical protein
MSIIYFSLKEADYAIKRIRGDIDRIEQLSEELQLIDNTKIEFDEDKIENLMLEVELNKSFHEKNLELYMLIGKLIKEGCIVRDIEKLEIDFYSKFDGRNIMLCWRPGEERIIHWHEVNENYTKRKPVGLIEKQYFKKLNELK